MHVDSLQVVDRLFRRRKSGPPALDRTMFAKMLFLTPSFAKVSVNPVKPNSAAAWEAWSTYPYREPVKAILTILSILCFLKCGHAVPVAFASFSLNFFRRVDLCDSPCTCQMHEAVSAQPVSDWKHDRPSEVHDHCPIQVLHPTTSSRELVGSREKNTSP